MEHRWGERVGVDIPVRITGHPFTVRTGRLSNLSVSGAFIRADVDVRPLSRILVAIELPQRSRGGRGNSRQRTPTRAPGIVRLW